MLGDSVRRRQPNRRVSSSHTSGRPRSRRRWKTWLIGLPLALLVPFGIGYLLAVYVIFPPTEVTTAGIPVPELVGRSASDAQRELAAVGLGALDVSELPHPDAPAGQVLAQSPLPGQQLRTGAGVRVALSVGPPRVVVPDVAGFSAERAESLLRGLGFEVDQAVQDSHQPAGRVLRVEPQPGEPLRLPARVTLIISSGPPEPLPSDTLPLPGDTVMFRL